MRVLVAWRICDKQPPIKAVSYFDQLHMEQFLKSLFVLCLCFTSQSTFFQSCLLFIPDVYVMGDDALISWRSFMQTKHLRVLIHI